VDVRQHEDEDKIPALKILVVDDNPANRILLAKQLAWLGQHAYLASAGNEALAIWEKQISM
jgi:two-component system sensor histidine kinase EvgS